MSDRGMSSTVVDRIARRHQALWATRSFFVAQGFVEVDTPLLVPGPGLEPHIDPLSVPVSLGPDGPVERRFLITSPELALKRVLAEGAPRVFQLSHVFRDGERTRRHLPEFSMLEWYRADATLDALIADTELLLAEVARATGVDAPSVPFERKSVASLFAEHAQIDLDRALAQMRDGDAQALVRAAKERGWVLRPGADFEDAFFAVMGDAIEPKIGLMRPCIVERWPAQMAVLARRCDDDPLYASRFEIYAGGLELSNAFDELTDPIEQRARFLLDNDTRRRLGKEALPLDEEFLRVLPQMRRTAGCALGVDRMLMYLWGKKDIDDVVSLSWR